jgi:hypothetical protein
MLILLTGVAVKFIIIPNIVDVNVGPDADMKVML